MVRKIGGIAFDIRGDAGEWLLLISGLGTTRHAWAYQLRELSAHFRCITFDNRGVGQSDCPPGPYSIEMMADDAAALLAGLGVKRTHVVGASMGGAIAQALALKHPQMIDRLAIACSWAGRDRYVDRCIAILRDAAERHGPQGAGWSIAVNRVISLLSFTVADFVETPAIIDALEQTAAKAAAVGVEQDWRGVLAQLDASAGHDLRGRLSAVTSPTLVLAGEDDRFTPAHLSRQLAAEIPGARLEIIERAGHVMFYERPAEFNRRLLRFLNASAA